MKTDYRSRVAELEATLAAAATNGNAPHSAALDRLTGEPYTLDVMTARELCELPDPPYSDELLGPLLVRGQRLVLGAHTGEGKSTMTAAIVRAVVQEEPFLDWTGRGGRALIIDAEQGLKTIKRRLREAGLDQSDQVDYIRAPDGLNLDSDRRHIAALDHQLREGEYTVVAADPLYKLHAGDSNAEREAVDLMRTFDQWRTELHFSLILPVHCRKPPIGAKFSMHEFFGSSAYLRGAEVIVGLQRIRDGYSRLHWFKDRDGDLPVGTAWGLLFNRETGYRRDPEDTADRKTATDQIRDLLEADPGMTQKQLQEATGYAERTVRKALKDINATPTGVVNINGEKQWQLPLGDTE